MDDVTIKFSISLQGIAVPTSTPGLMIVQRRRRNPKIVEKRVSICFL